jgi:hypothetical protein
MIKYFKNAKTDRCTKASTACRIPAGKTAEATGVPLDKDGVSHCGNLVDASRDRPTKTRMMSTQSFTRNSQSIT